MTASGPWVIDGFIGWRVLDQRLRKGTDLNWILRRPCGLVCSLCGPEMQPRRRAWNSQEFTWIVSKVRPTWPRNIWKRWIDMKFVWLNRRPHNRHLLDSTLQHVCTDQVQTRRVGPKGHKTGVLLWSCKQMCCPAAHSCLKTTPQPKLCAFSSCGVGTDYNVLSSTGSLLFEENKIWLCALFVCTGNLCKLFDDSHQEISTGAQLTRVCYSRLGEPFDDTKHTISCLSHECLTSSM